MFLLPEADLEQQPGDRGWVPGQVTAALTVSKGQTLSHNGPYNGEGT